WRSAVVWPAPGQPIAAIDADGADAKCRRSRDQCCAISQHACRRSFGKNGCKQNVCNTQRDGPARRTIVSCDLLHHPQRLRQRKFEAAELSWRVDGEQTGVFEAVDELVR